MCLPMAAVAAVSALATVASTVVGMQAQGQQADAAAQQARYSQAVAYKNAQIADTNARDARAAGVAAEEQQRLKTSQLQGRQTAVLAANGVDLASGSPLDILGDTAAMGEQDALNTRGNAERQARGYETQASNFRDDGQLAGMRSANAEEAGQTAQISTLVSGVGSVADKWYKMSNGGKTSPFA